MNTQNLTAALAALILTAAGIFAPGIAASATAAEPTTFEVLAGHYETMRQALASDRLDGVAEEAERFVAEVRRLEADFSPQRAGVEAAAAAEVRELLPELAAAAGELAAAADLKQAREAFYALSKPLIRYHKRVPEAGVEVAWCSMAHRAWLQPVGDEAMGNPYYGQSMLACGDVLEPGG